MAKKKKKKKSKITQQKKKQRKIERAKHEQIRVKQEKKAKRKPRSDKGVLRKERPETPTTRKVRSDKGKPRGPVGEVIKRPNRQPFQKENKPKPKKPKKIYEQGSVGFVKKRKFKEDSKARTSYLNKTLKRLDSLYDRRQSFIDHRTPWTPADEVAYREARMEYFFFHKTNKKNVVENVMKKFSTRNPECKVFQANGKTFKGYNGFAINNGSLYNWDEKTGTVDIDNPILQYL